MQLTHLLLTLPLLLTTTAAQLASVTWSDLQRIRVYGQARDGRIVEWQWDNAGRWTGPSWIGARARNGSPLTAVNSGDRLRVYYIDDNGSHREHVFEQASGWSNGANLGRT